MNKVIMRAALMAVVASGAQAALPDPAACKPKGVSVAPAVPLIVEARRGRGADDGTGHVRHGRGQDDPVGHG